MQWKLIVNKKHPDDSKLMLDGEVVPGIQSVNYGLEMVDSFVVDGDTRFQDKTAMPVLNIKILAPDIDVVSL